MNTGQVTMPRATVPITAPLAATKFGPGLVIFSALFNLILCFVNTRHWAFVGNTFVIAMESMILLVGFWLIRHHLGKTAIQISVLITLYLVGLKLIDSGLDLKILHDLAIMYIFYKLGTLSSIEMGNRTIWTVMIIVLVVGLFELLAPTIYGSVFDIWSYYVNKGVIGPNAINYSNTDFFVSGNRGSVAARNFFPGIFGTHRVSSVFLEPVSLGDFSVITFAWCLSTAVGSRRSRAMLFFLGAFCFVLADSRFASMCCIIMLVVRAGSFVKSNLIVFLIPVMTMIALTIIGSVKALPHLAPMIMDDDFSGRLLFSARLLNSWTLSEWLGLSSSAVYTADTGYAYFVNNLGLPLSLILLAFFAAHKQKTDEGDRMKIMVVVYFATALCIGSSVFTIKTAALLWYLYGTTASLSGSIGWLVSKKSKDVRVDNMTSIMAR